MQQYIKKFLSYEPKINALLLRERVLLFCVIMWAIYFFWDTLVFGTLFGSKEKTNENMQLVEQQVSQLTEQMRIVNDIIRKHPKIELSSRIKTLKQEKQNYENSIDSLTKQLIHPKDMAKLLAAILAQYKDLTIIKISNLAEEPLLQNQDKTGEPKIGGQIYRHGLQLEFTGGYFATQKFLQALENLPWKILWGEFNYEVSKYPNATIKIVIYTLSLQKSYIGT